MDIHVLSMSTGRPHSLAQRPIFDVSIGPFEWINTFQIHQELFFILAENRGEQILRVWNWKTGEDLYVSRLAIISSPQLRSLCALD